MTALPKEDPKDHFIHWLRSSGNCAEAEIMNDDMWVGVASLMFHWTLKIGLIGDEFGYEDRWCFADERRARAGLAEWRSRDFVGEPEGWRRHPATDRRRNDDGDPATQWIAH